MIGSIERLRRRLKLSTMAPMMLLVIGVPARPDPINKRTGGTSGVIPIPVPTAGSTLTGTHADMVSGEARHDARADRGRVLYSNGHIQRDSAAAVRTLRKHPCPEQRMVVQGRNGPASPNS